MKFLIVVGGACLLGAAVLGAVMSAWSRAKAQRARNSLVNRLGPRTVVLVDPVARFCGLASRGRGQPRCLGCLVLTADEVVFEPTGRGELLRVPRLAITAVTTGRVFLGRARGARLLQVAWTRADGSEERAAWQLDDLPAWRGALTSP